MSVSQVRDPRRVAAATESVNAMDRCDACGAPALARATGQEGSVLLFCRHHAEGYREGLEAQGFLIDTFYQGLSD